MLPMHPQPQPNEILSSWMARLAFSNGFHIHTFYANLLSYKAPIWNRDIDRHPPLALLKTLKLHTKQKVTTLQAMTLSSYNGLLFEELPRIGNGQWILPIGVFHRTRRRAGMQFCPLCLQDGPFPYFRQKWRLALYTICERHECVMQGACPNCQSPVAYHRHGIGRRKAVPETNVIRYCHVCLIDLGVVNPEYFDWPDRSSWLRFINLLRNFERKNWAVRELTLPCAIPFFHGLRALIAAINGRNGHKLRQQFKQRLGINMGAEHPARCIEFESMPSTERLKLLLSVTWLLNDWPERFIKLCIDAGFTRSRLAEEIESLPFWVSSVANKYLDQRSYIPTFDEINAAGRHLQSQQTVVTAQALGNVLGLSRDSAKNAWLQWQASLTPC